MTLQVRTATQADLPAIAAIQAASPEASQWDPASHLGYDCVVAEAEGAVVGFLVTRQVAPGEREILNLAVHPSHRRQGVARRLLKITLESGPGMWFLEVRASNFGAISLYKTMGFWHAGQRNGYYHDPPEPAIVMKIDS